MNKDRTYQVWVTVQAAYGSEEWPAGLVYGRERRVACCGGHRQRKWELEVLSPARAACLRAACTGGGLMSWSPAVFNLAAVGLNGTIAAGWLLVDPCRLDAKPGSLSAVQIANFLLR